MHSTEYVGHHHAGASGLPFASHRERTSMSARTKWFHAEYMGFTAMDRRFSSPMLPWVIAEICRREMNEKVWLSVQEGYVCVVDEENMKTIFRHPLVGITRIAFAPDPRRPSFPSHSASAPSTPTTPLHSTPTLTTSPSFSPGLGAHLDSGGRRCFFYLVRDPTENLLSCYLYRAPDSATVVELFTSMREQSAREANGNGPQARSFSSAAALTSLCADISPSSSHFFEVLYIGKIKVSHRKVPETFIDEALERFRVHEKEKAQRRARLGFSTSSHAILGTASSHGSPPKNVPSQSSTSSTSATQTHSTSPPPTIVEDATKTSQADVLPESRPGNVSNFQGNLQQSEDSEKPSIYKYQDPNFSCAGKLSTETLRMVASSVNEATSLCTESGTSSISEEPPSESKNLISDGDDARNSSLTTESQEVLVCNQASGNNTLYVRKPHAMLSEGSRMSSQDSGCTSPLELGSNENLSTVKESSQLTSQLQNKLQETVGAKGGGASNIVKEQKFHSPELPIRHRTCSGDTYPNKQSHVPMEPMRVRAGSIGSSSNPHRVDNHSAEFKQSETSTNTEHNRTMLFQVGRTDLRLISPDRKQILMHKYLRDVVNCIQGAKNPDYFGFICKEPNVECFVGYVFRCQSGSVADDVAGAITQAFSATNDPHRKDKHKAQVQQPPPVVSCEHCPMVWYHKLCAEIEGLNDRRTQATIFRRLEQLPDDEQESVMIKFRGAETVSGKSGSPGRDGSTNNGSSIREQNEFLMMLLRAHCEAKQPRHVHDTAENRHEFLNHYLGGSTIFMKAKRSLTSSFDHLLKRRGSKDDFLAPPVSKELSLPITATLCKDTISSITTVTANSRSPSGENLKESPTNTPVRDLAPSVVTTPAVVPSTNVVKVPSPINADHFRPRSSTVGSSGGETMKREVLARKTSTSKPIAIPLTSPQQQHINHAHQKSPMMNIFFKVGNQPKNTSGTSPNQEKSPNTRNKQHGSWRQAIYNRVVTPGKSLTLTGGDPGESGVRIPLVKKEKAELRALWRKAIMQQILLIRMDKENARLTARQEEATVKRIKLDYDEISPCLKQVNEVWELLVSKESRISAKCDSQMLLQAIRQGVPRSKRGEVWQFLAEQHNLRTHPVDISHFPNYNVTYRGLLKQLTSHQHGILVDLGRTFPNHPYFSSPLGPGQLELFNLLKAYSLLDPEVGYCQGLSFVAGVLLLHMSEESAFLLLRHLLFRRDLRRQYLPDMAALQVQLYQLSRLLHDTYPDLYEHFDQNEVAPTLYAAPWILTIFASQFPLGFVTRVFDLLFLEGPDVVFRFALALLGEWKTELLACTNFEEIMECLKTTVPNMDKHMLDNVLKQVFTMDITKLLHEYEVEYHVLQEEMASSIPEADSTSRNLRQQNSELSEQLKEVQDNNERLEALTSSQKAAISCLESQVRSLENTLGTMARYIASLHDKISPASNQQPSNRFTNNLPQIPEMPPDIWKYVAAFSKSGLSSSNPVSSPSPVSPPNSVIPTTISSNSTMISNGAPPGWLQANKSKAALESPFSTITPPILKTSLSTSDLYSVRSRNGTTPLSVSPLVLPPASVKKIESLTYEANLTDADKPAEASPSGAQMHPLDSIAGDVSFTFGTSSLRSLKPGRGGANSTGSTRAVQNSSEDNFVLTPAERSLSDGMKSVPRGENGLIRSGR